MQVGGLHGRRSVTEEKTSELPNWLAAECAVGGKHRVHQGNGRLLYNCLDKCLTHPTVEGGQPWPRSLLTCQRANSNPEYRSMRFEPPRIQPFNHDPHSRVPSQIKNSSPFSNSTSSSKKSGRLEFHLYWNLSESKKPFVNSLAHLRAPAA